MIVAKAKVDIVNKYRAPRKYDIPMTDAERKTYRRIHKNATEDDFFITITQPVLFAAAGEEVFILSEDIGSHRSVAACANKANDRIPVDLNDLIYE